MKSLATLAASLLIACTFAAPAAAQDDLARRQQLSKEVVQEVFRYGGFDALLDQATDAGMMVMTPTVEQALKRQLTRTENDSLRTMFHNTMADVFPQDVWLGPLADIYAKYFSVRELNSILTFYRTPEGASFLKLMGTITREGARVGESVVATRQQQFVEKFQAEFVKVFGNK